MTDFLSLCRSRRSIRKYTEQPVPREKLEYMLRCALMSPSAKRLNPWEFFVTTNKSQIEKMASCKAFGAQMLLTAKAAIAVAADDSKTDTWQADAAIAAEHLLLAAEDRGLGACWCHILDRDQAEQCIKNLLQIPDNLRVLCVIAVGEKNEERKQYDLDKLPYEKIHYVE